MKRTIFKTTAIVIMVLFSIVVLAQNPPHPNGGGGPGSGNTPVGGAAPIDGGITIMMFLGAAYASKKMYKANFNNNEL